jgi:hypothetical protein
MPVEKSVVEMQLAFLGSFSRWGTKKEIGYLHEVLVPDEGILAITSGFHDGNTWLVTVTDRRVIFLDKGMVFGLKQMEMPLSQISAVSHKVGLVLGRIEVSTSGGSKVIDNIDKTDVVKVAQILSDLINKEKQPQPTNTLSASDPPVDIVSQLERLVSLKERGVLTDEEFAQQKARILSA